MSSRTAADEGRKGGMRGRCRAGLLSAAAAMLLSAARLRVSAGATCRRRIRQTPI